MGFSSRNLLLLSVAIAATSVGWFPLLETLNLWSNGPIMDLLAEAAPVGRTSSMTSRVLLNQGDASAASSVTCAAVRCKSNRVCEQETDTKGVVRVKCVCLPNYIEIEGECQRDMCATVRCAANTKCVQSTTKNGPTVQCKCLPGFVKSTIDGSCVVPICANVRCPTFSRCVKRSIGVHCKCLYGYKKADKKCVPV